MDIAVAVFTIVGVMITNIAMIMTMFFWVRGESRADTRHNDAKLESTRELVRAIHDEVKDFHARLLEAQRK